VKEVKNYYVTNGLDKKYGVLQNKQIYAIRSKLKKAGLMDKADLVIKSDITDIPKSTLTPEISETKEENKGIKSVFEDNKGEVPPSITRRLDWDVLTPKIIERIPDPKLPAFCLQWWRKYFHKV